MPERDCFVPMRDYMLIYRMNNRWREKNIFSIFSSYANFWDDKYMAKECILKLISLMLLCFFVFSVWNAGFDHCFYIWHDSSSGLLLVLFSPSLREPQHSHYGGVYKQHTFYLQYIRFQEWKQAFFPLARETNNMQASVK